MDKKKVVAIAVAIAAVVIGACEALKANGVALPSWATAVLVVLAYLVKSPLVSVLESDDKGAK